MLLVHSLIIIATCVIATIGSDDALPCIKSGTTEQCYKIVDTTVRWTEASRICKDDGGMLVIIESVEEQNFITEQMTKTKFTVNGLWMGSNNLHPEAQRTWSNGNKFTYQNWAGGETINNEVGLNKNCAEISTANMKWKSNICSAKRGYICEITLDCYTESTTYTGQQSVTIRGKMCQAWSLNTPHPHKYHNDSMFPDGKKEAAANYCRDPSRFGYLWCYTVDLAKQSEKCPTLSCNVTAQYEPCVKDETSGHCYQIVDTLFTWNQAFYICKRDGGTLVIIDTDREQKFVEGLMLNKTIKTSALWIGANMLHPEKQRTWVNGEKFSYANWAQGEPNGHVEEENCAEIYTYNGKWNDRPCTYRKGHICENLRSAKEYIQDESTGRWYKLADNRNTWTEAFNICKSEGGTLMIIETVQEQKFIESQVMKKRFTTEGLWIGSNSLHQETQHTWTNGSNFTFTNWDNGEPNNSPLPENCAEIFTSNRKWNDQLCTNQRGYICEKTTPVAPNSSQQTFFVISIALGSALVFIVGVLVLYCLIQKRTNCKKKKDKKTQDKEKEEGYRDLHDLATNQAEHVYNRSSALDHNYSTIDDIV